MKQIILLALIIIAVLLTGIIFMTAKEKDYKNTNGSHSANEEAKRAYQIENPEKWYPVHTYKHDGCEYVVFGYGSNAWGGHKGNCSNPIHQNNR